jgi:ABC-type proline/glycine betaine transport system ATPase subunit
VLNVEEINMNQIALMSAMKEKEMINLIMNLMKYRDKKGKEKFQSVLKQMNLLLEMNNEEVIDYSEAMKELNK